MSWSETPCVGEAHMMHICWIWQMLVPIYRPAITRPIAAEMWMIYRAQCREAAHGGGPLELPMEVRAMQKWTNELWLLYTQMQ